MRKFAIIADISGSFYRGKTKYIPLDSPNPDEEFGAWLRYLECKGAEIFKIPRSFFLRTMRVIAIIAAISGSFDRAKTKYIPLDSPNPDEEFGAWLRYLECFLSMIRQLPRSFFLPYTPHFRFIADISGSFYRGKTKYIPLDSPNPDEEFGAWLRYLECKGAEIF